MADDVDGQALEFPLLPLKNVVVFPRTIVNLTVGRARSIQALNAAAAGDGTVVLAAQRDNSVDDPGLDRIHTVGTLIEIKQIRKQPDSTVQVEVEALRRVRIVDLVHDEPYLQVAVEEISETPASGKEVDALSRQINEMFKRYAGLNTRVPQDAVEHLRAARNAGYLADLAAAHSITDMAERQRVLEITGQMERLQHMAGVLLNAVDLLETDQRVRDKVRASLDKNQREFYLREQLKAIHDELASDGGNEYTELRERISARGLPADTLQKVLKEVNKLERMPSMSPETTVLRNYLDWVLALPWKERTEDRIDLPLSEQILDEDHYGLAQVKERILDFLAVRQLTLRRQKARKEGDPAPGEEQARQQGAILCFVGPPGVGKTSLGQSIAKAMNRKFVRLSLGGVHDEAEIRGHRRTYVGAMPGRIVQAMKGAGSTNPVMLLDEVDKMTSDMRGDPSAALLEVLDPAQNHTYVDHYLDVAYDLSDVLFIATANTLYNIPRPLRDRMEIIEIGGYTEEEKLQISRQHLLPRQIEGHGLELGFLEVPDRMLRSIIRTHTREAGVRELDRKLATLCRKAARKVVQGRTTRVRVTPHNLEEFLGPARFRADVEKRQDQVGVATGLAWTEHGGELLPVEVAIMPGRGSLTITGRLGDVMQESARAALTFARSRAAQLNIDLETLERNDIHIHLPEGAIPKDGPSAGITMATALISALTRRPIRSDVGMTGEVTLTGRVLAIGGLKEKTLALHRAGIKLAIAPLANKSDWNELPLPVRREIEFVWVETMDEVINIALRPAEEQPAVPVGREPLVRLPENDAIEPANIGAGEDRIDDLNRLPADVPAAQPAQARPRKPRAASSQQRGST